MAGATWASGGTDGKEYSVKKHKATTPDLSLDATRPLDARDSAPDRAEVLTDEEKSVAQKAEAARELAAWLAKYGPETDWE
jgi:hypothetical protein